MLNALFTKLFGSRNERVVKKMGRVVDQVNVLEDAHKALSDEELKAKTAEYRQRVSDGDRHRLLGEASLRLRDRSHDRGLLLGHHL